MTTCSACAGKVPMTGATMFELIIVEIAIVLIVVLASEWVRRNVFKKVRQ